MLGEYSLMHTRTRALWVAALCKRAVFQMANSGSGAWTTTEVLVDCVLQIAESWAVLAVPDTESLALLTEKHARLERQLVRAYNEHRLAEGNVVFALITEWLAVVYQPPALFTLCSALHRATEAAQDVFFTVCPNTKHTPHKHTTTLLLWLLLDRCCEEAV